MHSDRISGISNDQIQNGRPMLIQKPILQGPIPPMMGKMINPDIVPIDYHPRHYPIQYNHQRIANYPPHIMNPPRPHIISNHPIPMPQHFPPYQNMIISPQYPRNVVLRVPPPHHQNYPYIRNPDEMKYAKYYPEYQNQMHFDECYMAHTAPCCPRCYDHYMNYQSMINSGRPPSPLIYPPHQNLSNYEQHLSPISQPRGDFDENISHRNSSKN